MKRYVILLLISAVVGLGVWALLRFTGARRWALRHSANQLLNMRRSDAELWNDGVEKVKAERGEPMGTSAAVEVPAELRHYPERRWFLATQVAEVRKHNVQTCHDFLELAAMIERHEMADVPAATESYILFGVGQQADEKPFSRYQDDQRIDLYNETQLSDQYQALDATRARLQNQIAGLKTQSSKLTKRERSRQRELQKEIASLEQQLAETNEDKENLDEFYGPEGRQKLFDEYASLQTLARNFRGRSFDLSNPADREAMKITMLSSLRPPAFKLMEELAASYHRTFARPLPVSSLIRPEEYQRGLRRVNRFATNIDTPPHSTGLAFDINYRYMSAAEQTFVMTELARLESQGRIEVLREPNANYHVFVFIDGSRPSDELITASMDDVGSAPVAAHHAKKSPPKARKKVRSTKKAKPKAKPKARPKARARRR
jgi:hypothetical protein